jgi:hypothetical protein
LAYGREHPPASRERRRGYQNLAVRHKHPENNTILELLIIFNIYIDNINNIDI